MDLLGYDAFMSGKLDNCPLPEEPLQASLQSMRGLPHAEARKTGRW